jgi:hypothetical protein
MNAQYLGWFFGAAALVFALWMWTKSRDNRASKSDPQFTSAAGDATQGRSQLPKESTTHEPALACPAAIVLGDESSRAGIRIASLKNDEYFHKATPIPANSSMAGRLAAGLQAVPSLLVAQESGGRRLMEVVIQGDLVRASSGGGLRAWAVDANNRVAEHAQLFDAGKLQNMINAAAVWQVASVIVAQKHLADISAKLNEIKDCVQGIAHFLNEERRARLTGTYAYLELAVSAVGNGELSPAIRVELESCDRDLLQIQHHLQQELKRLCAKPVEHTEFAGTEDLARDASNKFNKLKSLADDVRLTLKTRALASYVLSLYPGESALKQARMDALLASAQDIKSSLGEINECAEDDCRLFKSFWNSEETLLARKEIVRDAAKALVAHLESGAEEARTDVQASQQLLLKHDQPIHLVFEANGGHIGELRLAPSLAMAA